MGLSYLRDISGPEFIDEQSFRRHTERSPAIELHFNQNVKCVMQVFVLPH